MGDYKINGVEVQDPTTGEWVIQRELGKSGSGRSVVPPLREFKLQWNFMSIADFDEVRDEWRKDQITGSVTADLPDLLANSYTFRTFSGCHLEEPRVAEYFQEYVSDVVLVVTCIRV